MKSLIRIKEAAEVLGVDAQTVKNWISRDLIETLEINNKSVYVKKDSLDRLMNSDLIKLEATLEKEKARISDSLKSIETQGDDIVEQKQVLRTILKSRLITPFFVKVLELLSSDMPEKEAQILRDVFSGNTYEEVAEKVGLTRERISQIVRGSKRYFAKLEKYNNLVAQIKKDSSEIKEMKTLVIKLHSENENMKELLQIKGIKSKKVIDPAVLEKSITACNPSVRLFNVCFRYDITTLGDLSALEAIEFKKLRGCGNKTVKEAEVILKKHGLSFGFPVYDEYLKKIVN